MKTAADTAQAVGAFCCIVDHLACFLDDGVYLGIVFVPVILCNLKQLCFSLLYEVSHISRFVKGACLDMAGKGDELSCHVFLGNDAGIIFHVSRTAHGVA